MIAPRYDKVESGADLTLRGVNVARTGDTSAVSRGLPVSPRDAMRALDTLAALRAAGGPPGLPYANDGSLIDLLA